MQSMPLSIQAIFLFKNNMCRFKVKAEVRGEIPLWRKESKWLNLGKALKSHREFMELLMMSTMEMFLKTTPWALPEVWKRPWIHFEETNEPKGKFGKLGNFLASKPNQKKHPTWGLEKRENLVQVEAHFLWPQWFCCSPDYNNWNIFVPVFHFSGDSNDLQFPRPRDLDLIQSTPLETLSLKTPPRVLTLNERPLDFLEEEQRVAPNSEEVVSEKAIYSIFMWCPKIPKSVSFSKIWPE